MRRHALEIKDRHEIEAVMRRAEVCRVGLSENDAPYVVPMLFGYRDKYLYLHCANKGKKLDMMRQNSNVCFEMDIDYEIVRPAGHPCRWGAKYRSVIGFGRSFIVEGFQEKSAALNIIVQHYGGEWYDFSEKDLQKVCVVKIEIDSMTGKKAGC
jgi:nitroimidazol reductase NimA-like FMN-containing flavoprotein (pyridoxamine 5'-phosphate oxidase superfamily)